MRALNGVKLYFTVAPMFEREIERERDLPLLRVRSSVCR